MSNVDDELIVKLVTTGKEIETTKKYLKSITETYNMLSKILTEKYDYGTFTDTNTGATIEVEQTTSYSSRYKDLLDALELFIGHRLAPLIEREYKSGNQNTPELTVDILLKEIIGLRKKYIGVKSEPQKDVAIIS